MTKSPHTNKDWRDVALSSKQRMAHCVETGQLTKKVLINVLTETEEMGGAASTLLQPSEGHKNDLATY